MHDKWTFLSEHFNAKISRMDKQSRIAILQAVKADLGILGEQTEILY